jgi:hypothetical protein
MNTLTYSYYAFLGLLFCMGLTARIIFGNVDTVSWPLWILGGVVYFIAIKFLWRVIQRGMFGDFLIIDIAKFVPPPFCATCFRKATETRTAFFSSTSAGPIEIHQRAELPLKLCAECAQHYDSKLLKGIKGVRIARVVYDKWTVQFKNFDYYRVALESNRQNEAARPG